MDFAIAKEIAVDNVQLREPVLFAGAPGIGKTDLAEQIASELGYDLMVSHPVTADPTDAKGLPFRSADGRTADFLPYGDLHRAMTAARPLLWMLDDLGQATPAVQASYMQLLLSRKINGHHLSEFVTFMAATNRKRDRAGVMGMLEPVKSRFGAIIELETSVNAWITWAIGNGMPAELMAFLRFKPELLLNELPSTEIAAVNCPRTWGKLGKGMAKGIRPEILPHRIETTVGPVAGKELSEFLTVWREMPSPEAILLAPGDAAIPAKLSTLYAVSTALATRANPDNFGRICTYAERIAAGGSGEIASMLVNDCVRHHSDIKQSGAYAKVLTGPLADLLG